MITECDARPDDRVNMLEEMPDWVPEPVLRYLLHTEAGISIRSLARSAGCHASTVLRQVRQFENRREDLLIDQALHDLGISHFQMQKSDIKRDGVSMTAAIRNQSTKAKSGLECEAPRVLRRLSVWPKTS